jgi:hypothetical protein
LEEEAIRKAEEEAKAAMEPILRFDSAKDEEKEYLRRKEQELTRLLEEHVARQQEQQAEIERQK